MNSLWRNIVSKYLLKIQLYESEPAVIHFFERSVFVEKSVTDLDEQYVFEVDGKKRTILSTFEPRDATWYWESELFQLPFLMEFDEFEKGTSDRLICLAIMDFGHQTKQLSE